MIAESSTRPSTRRGIGWAKGAFLAAAMVFAGTANASLLGVKFIEVRSAIPTWLQVSEVVATETGTGNDLALASAGATATAFSVGFGGLPANAIDGLGPAAHPAEYHSGGTGAGEFLRIELASASALDSITLMGRTDCCSARDVYDLFVYDMNNVLLYSASDLDTNAASPLHEVMVSFTGGATAPEPGSLVLIAAGLAAFGGFARRRRVAVA